MHLPTRLTNYYSHPLFPIHHPPPPPHSPSFPQVLLSAKSLLWLWTKLNVRKFKRPNKWSIWILKCPNFCDSDDDFRSGCRNVSQRHPKQSFSGLHSPGRLYFTVLWEASFTGIKLLLNPTPIKCQEMCLQTFESCFCVGSFMSGRNRSDNLRC